MQQTREADIYTWASAITKCNPLFLDTETTGLTDRAEVIEIAVVDIAGNILLDELIKGQEPVPQKATSVHGITDEMLQDARAFPGVCNALFEIIRGRMVVVYNAQYDFRMLRQTAARYGLAMRFSAMTFTDLMIPYAEHFGEWNEYRQSFRWQKLETACHALGIPEGGHRAKNDADAARQVLLALARKDFHE